MAILGYRALYTNEKDDSSFGQVLRELKRVCEWLSWLQQIGAESATLDLKIEVVIPKPK